MCLSRQVHILNAVLYYKSVYNVHTYLFAAHIFILHPASVLTCVTPIFQFPILKRLHDSGKQIIKAITMFSYLQELEISVFKINYQFQLLKCRQCYRYSIKLLECAILNHNERHFCQKCILICEAIRKIYQTSIKKIIKSSKVDQRIIPL